jgi:hypothetical protein
MSVSDHLGEDCHQEPEHLCEGDAGGYQCGYPGVVHHDGQWFCLAHTDKVIWNKTKDIEWLKEKRDEAAKTTTAY